VSALLRRALLAWYQRHRRDLPWRRGADAYAVWVSEVMLQQTTVRSALDYYQRFMERFPTVEALAGACEEDVLAAWSGLGYYHRARSLHRAARQLQERHGGVFPRTLEAALALPGVGLYSASAVLSIAYGVALPVVDGNVRRVLGRLLALRGPEYRRDGPYYNRAEELLDRERPGEWNQALMELGATLCLPRRPACPACPVRAHCRARASGIVDELPVGRPRRPAVPVTVAAALVVKGGRVLLVRRPPGGLLAGMWEVPQTSLESKGLPDLAAELRERHGLRVVPGVLVVRARHAITHHRITLEGYSARLASAAPPDGERLRWAALAELGPLALTAASRKLLRGLGTPQLPLPL